MEKKKNIPLIIVSILLVISLLGNFLFAADNGALIEENELANNMISELNRGAEIDFEYVNQQNELNRNYYSVWQSCNDMLSKELRGDLPISDLQTFMTEYESLVNQTKTQQDLLSELKQKRSDEYASFKFVTVSKPEN